MTVTHTNTKSESNSFILNDSKTENRKSHSNGKMSSKVFKVKILGRRSIKSNSSSSFIEESLNSSSQSDRRNSKTKFKRNKQHTMSKKVSKNNLTFTKLNTNLKCSNLHPVMKTLSDVQKVLNFSRLHPT